MKYLAIDPGSSPVLAASDGPGTPVVHWTEARGMQDLPDRLRKMFGTEGPVLIGLEQPPYYMDGDAVQAATKFAEAGGIMKGILTALGWAPRTKVYSPLEWMAGVCPSHEWPSGKRNYGKRKKFFDEHAAGYFGQRIQNRIKRGEGDALCILSLLETSE